MRPRQASAAASSRRSAAIVDQGRVRPGEWVAIHGCGGVGLSAIMIASAMGANVIAIDRPSEKLDFAREIGAVATVNASETADVVGAVREITRGGAHVSMDALGHPTTCFNSIANLRRRGRHIQVGLMLGEHAHPQIPMDKVIAHELEIRGSHGMQAFRYSAMMDMIEAGKLGRKDWSARRSASTKRRRPDADGSIPGDRHRRDHELLGE